MDQAAAPLSPPGIAMIIVLVACSIALIGLVVTLPAVKNLFRRNPHTGPGLPHAATGHR
jgi:hypothetical protein